MRKILLTLMVLMIMAMPVMALEPCPIAVKFLTSPESAKDGLIVDIYHAGSVISTEISKDGEILADLGDRISNCGSQSFQITVRNCADKAACTQSVSFNPQGYTTIDLTSVWIDISTTTTITTTSTTTQPGIIPCDICEELDWESLILIVIGLIGVTGLVAYSFKKGNLVKYASQVFKVGQYVRLGKYWDGAVSAKHLHKGIRGYHDPDIEHRDPEDRHPKGKLAGKEVP